MKRSFNYRSALSLPEVMVALAVSSVLLAALIGGSVSLEKTFDATERYSASELAAERINDYLGLDLRRAVATGTASTYLFRDTVGSALFTSNSTAVLSSGTDFVLNVPAFYQSNDRASGAYRKPYPLVSGSGKVGYGMASGTLSSPVKVRYWLDLTAKCIKRDEIFASTSNSKVIAEKVDNMKVSIKKNTDSTFTTQVWFVPVYSQHGVTAAAYQGTGGPLTTDTVKPRN